MGSLIEFKYKNQLSYDNYLLLLILTFLLQIYNIFLSILNYIPNNRPLYHKKNTILYRQYLAHFFYFIDKINTP